MKNLKLVIDQKRFSQILKEGSDSISFPLNNYYSRRLLNLHIPNNRDIRDVYTHIELKEGLIGYKKITLFDGGFCSDNITFELRGVFLSSCHFWVFLGEIEGLNTNS